MMGREALRAYLKSRHAAETPLKPHETPEQGIGFQKKILMNQGFISTETPETLETSINTDSRENFQPLPCSEAVNDPASSGRHGLERPAPAKPVKLKYLEWADGWLELDQAYQRHHWSCPQCQAEEVSRPATVRAFSRMGLDNVLAWNWPGKVSPSLGFDGFCSPCSMVSQAWRNLQRNHASLGNNLVKPYIGANKC